MTVYLIVTLALNALALWAALRIKAGHTSTPWTEGQIRASVLVRSFLVAWAALLLAGCGGGDAEPDQPTPAVDCRARPEVCK